jgi:hypothetical protein
MVNCRALIEMTVVALQRMASKSVHVVTYQKVPDEARLGHSRGL